MKCNALRYACFALAPLIFAACDQVASPVPQTPSAELSADAQRTNASLDKMARLFAQAVTDSTLRQQIHDGATKRFDGDTNVLYKTLAASTGVRGALATAYSRDLELQGGDALSQIDALARDIPRFQVAVPANLDAWDVARYTPLVGFVPTGIDDTALTSITAYDAAGKAHQLDAKVAPKSPVIILGLSERTDDAGNLLESYAADQATTDMLYASSCKKVEVEGIDLYSDKEPWVKGDAEVMLIAKSYSGRSLYTHDAFVGANHDDGGYYDYNRVIGCTSRNIIFHWYEDDAGGLDFTVTYKGVSLETRIADEDDFLFQHLVLNKYVGGKVQQYRGGNMRFDVR